MGRKQTRTIESPERISMEAAPQTIEQSKSRPVTLKDVQAPIAQDLKEFRAYFRNAMRNDVVLLDRIVQYLLRRKGKQLRPMLVLLLARACGGITDSTYRGAALVELLHTATLVHDDVVDDASQRRGVFSVNALWKNKIAVLMGDFLLSRGLLMALDFKEYELLHIVSDAVRRMSEGELLQIDKARKLDIDESTYFRIISDKTASLISACTRIGATSASTDHDLRSRMHLFGEKLGIAFQIRDDLFDYGIVDVGKPLGIDLQEKKMTLPLIHALQAGNEQENKEVMRIVRKKRKSREDIRQVATFVVKHGGDTYARSKMDSYAAEALGILLELPDSPARTALEDLVAFTVSRSH
jgi:octaprenyl-diphosphate synthase